MNLLIKMKDDTRCVVGFSCAALAIGILWSFNQNAHSRNVDTYNLLAQRRVKELIEIVNKDIQIYNALSSNPNAQNLFRSHLDERINDLSSYKVFCQREEYVPDSTKVRVAKSIDEQILKLQGYL